MILRADSNTPGPTRRDFLRLAAAGSLAALSGEFTHSLCGGEPIPLEPVMPEPESLVHMLCDSLSEMQRKVICFDWNHVDPRRGLLRTHVANNWSVTRPTINSEFYTMDQRMLIRDIFTGLIQPDWQKPIDQQLDDDAGGFGESQSIGIFHDEASGKFELVMTGRHMTLRCDGNSSDHVAFGGPIFYGHDPRGNFYEAADHAGNVYWEQALAANSVYQMLDGRQRKQAEVARTPREGNAAFRGKGGKFAGIPVSELSADQQAEVQQVLRKLIEPYRQTDQDEVIQCLQAQGGLEQCHLAFYTDEDIGRDKVWDNWRLEGPAFVWHFRGAPHVHVWVSVADNPAVPFNAPGRGAGRREES